MLSVECIVWCVLYCTHLHEHQHLEVIAKNRKILTVARRSVSSRHSLRNRFAVSEQSVGSQCAFGYCIACHTTRTMFITSYLPVYMYIATAKANTRQTGVASCAEECSLYRRNIRGSCYRILLRDSAILSTLCCPGVILCGRFAGDWAQQCCCLRGAHSACLRCSGRV